MTSRSISRLFVESRAPDQIVAITHDRQIDLAQFHRDVAINAMRLRQMACNRALLGCSDTYWAAVGLLALFHAGASAVMPQNMRPDSLATIDDRWDCVVCDTPPGPGHNVFTLLPSEGDTPSLSALDPDACHLDIFTSGSTGRPKRVAKTLSLLEREAAAVEQLFGGRLVPSSHVHATVSHQHLYGLTFGLIWPLYAGRPFHGETHEIWETVLATKLGGAVLITSPAHLTRLSGFSPLPEARRPALILSAGSPLPAFAAQEAAQILGTSPTEIFGSTETGAVAWRNWTAPVPAPTPAWRPLPGVDVQRLADGRMSVASPFIAGNSRRYTGADLIIVQEDGSFEALGRTDDIVKVEGKRVSLMEIEAQLRQSPLVTDAAVTILTGDQPRLGALIVPSDEGALELRALGTFRFGQLLRRQLTARLESTALPKSWRFVSAIPSVDLGKRRTADILALFAENVQPAGNMPEATPEQPDEPELRSKRTMPDGIELDLFIPVALRQLDGHFPNLPIVPGVAQIDWAAKYAARHLNLGDGVAMSLQVKFRRVMSPGHEVTLVLKHQPERRRMSFAYRQQDEVLASGSFSLATT